MELYKNYYHYKQQLEKINIQLANPKFLEKAAPNMVLLTQQKHKDFCEKLETLFVNIKSSLIGKLQDECWLTYYIQYYREIQYLLQNNITLESCDFSDEYFNIVYNPELKNEEIVELWKEIVL